MRTEYRLYPQHLELKENTLTFKLLSNDLHAEKSLTLSVDWLKQWNERLQRAWPSIEQQGAAKGQLQFMLEGEAAVLLLPWLLAQSTHAQYKKHLIYSSARCLQASDWLLIADFYQQAGLDNAAYQAVFEDLALRWPLSLPGVHRLDFERRGDSLTLGFGDPVYMQQQWVCSVDVFIRDEQAGQPALPWVLRYAAEQSHFLMDEASLESEEFNHAIKKAGIRLSGRVGQRAHLAQQPAKRAKTMAIIGGGLAGAGISMVMVQRGWDVTVFDPAFERSLACQHDGHLVAAMTPFISVDDNHKSRLSRQAILRALYHWRDFPDDVIVSSQGNLEINRDKGYGKDISLAVEKLGFTEDWVQALNAEEMSERLGFDLDEAGVYWPLGRLISPHNLLVYIYGVYDINRQAVAVKRLQPAPDNSAWVLFDDKGAALGQYEQVVLANAADSMALLEQSELLERRTVTGEVRVAMPKVASTMHWMGGEVMHVEASRLKQVPRISLGGQGYFLPPNADGLCVLGSTYRHGERDPGLSQEGQAVIKEKMPVDLSELTDGELEGGWSGGRAVVQGRLPVICELDYAKGVWLAVAYGSHGLTWSSFAGDIIGTQLDGEPVPLERELLKAIALR